MYLPKPISDFLASAEIKPAQGGMSCADVYRCQISTGKRREIYYLKVEPERPSMENEHRLYRWLYEKKCLPVPEPLFCISEENPQDEMKKYGYLLIRKAEGEILEGEKYYASPARLAKLAAEGIKLLHRVEVEECPVKVNLEDRLKLAEENLKRGKSGELDASVPYTKEFKNHREVFDFLVKNPPEVVPVFTHGDYCLNNFFTDGEQITAFIDFGNGGVGDAYQDIALCVRELTEYCPEAIPRFYELLGIRKPDEEKLRYYMLLDELF